MEIKTKKNYNPYKSFENFVLRTPLLPLDFYLKLTENDILTDKEIKEAFRSPIIREAIFLASPSLYKEIIKWTETDEENEKLKYALLKYLTRMASRCTPFGLFAGCCIGGFGEKTSIRLKGPFENGRHTRFDMNFLVALSQDLARDAIVKKNLLFYPNTSIYRVGNEYRYIEYKYVNGKRQHQIVEVGHSEYVQLIFEKAKNGARLSELTMELVTDEISLAESTEFIEELVESQFLISDLEPSVSGPEFSKQILANLKKLEGTQDYQNFF